MATDLKTAAAPGNIDVPAHVPQDLVCPLDFYHDPEMRRDPFERLMALHKGPRIFWNPVSARYGHGAWVLTRADDIRHVLNTPERFSSAGWSGHSALSGATWSLVPLELDAPRHGPFRSLLNQWFAPGVVKAMAEDVRRRAVELIDAVVDRGDCEFIEDFARPFPVSIFMDVLGLPREEIPVFLQWEYDLLHTTDIARRVEAAKVIIAYLEDVANDRRRRPAGDLISRIVQSKVEGRLVSGDEAMGILFTLFLGSLDTVASSLGFHFRHLAEHPGLQARIRGDEATVNRSVEELLRRFTPVNARRRAVADTEIAGVTVRAGEWVTIAYALASLDPAEFDHPAEVDIDRKNNRHLAFAYGPHFCVGAHLARLELRTALVEWMRRAPPFRITSGGAPRIHAGGVYGVDYLPLSWS